VAPANGRWPRRPRTLDGAWDAIQDLREEIDGMLSAEMIADAAQAGAARARSQWLTTGRGLFVVLCTAVTAVAALITAAHSWAG